MDDNRWAQAKMNMVLSMTDALESNGMVAVLNRNGTDRGQELAFQRERVKWLQWAIANCTACVEKRLTELEGRLSPNQLKLKYRNLEDVPFETVRLLAFIEDMEICLGKHPAQQPFIGR